MRPEVTVPDGFATRAQYARRRNVSRRTVYRRTVPGGGPIPVHGERRLLKIEEADALWFPTNAPKRANGRTNGYTTGEKLILARVTALALDVEAKKLALEERRGTLMSRDVATRKAFAFARLWRDRWLTWPARVGPVIAAALDVDAGAVTVMLETHVREHLADLANERPGM